MLNGLILSIGANAMRSAMTHYSLHVDIPDSGGSDESSAPRKPSAWSPVSPDGDLISAAVSFTGGESLGPVKAVGFWDAAEGGSYFGYYPLSGDQSFNGAGDYTVGAFTLVGGST